MKLGELIESRKRDLHLTLEGLAEKARASGYELSRASLSTFTNHELAEAPRRRTMEAIAAALDVGYAEVVMAVAHSLIGSAPLEATNLQHVNALLTILGGRTDEEVASVLRVVRTVTTALDAAHAQGLEGARTASRSDQTAPPDVGGA